MYRRNNRKRKNRLTGISTGGKSGYIVPNSITYTGTELIWSAPWPSNFWTRASTEQFAPYAAPHAGNGIRCSRPNWVHVTALHHAYPMSDLLANRFYAENVIYRGTTGARLILNTLIPAVGHNKAGSNKPTGRYAYSPWYTPMYIAFRYILWDPNANIVGELPRGQIISGPLSRVVKISHTFFPFNFNYPASAYIGNPTTDISPNHNAKDLRCQFETKLP
jgi:hypothetical protein